MSRETCFAPAEAAHTEECGADSVVATDFDEGGALPDMTRGTVSIVPPIADAVKSIPVMAAGGICDSRAFKAAVLAANAKDLPLFRIR